MEAGLVGPGQLREARAQAVEQSVGGLVGDDVVREASEGTGRVAVEIAEEEALILLRVESVGLAEGMGSDVQLMAAEAPGDPAAERELEASQSAHDDRVDVLGMEVGACEQTRLIGVVLFLGQARERIGELAVDQIVVGQILVKQPA